ncbi:MarR family winged helix-turn-helix transcriptional regulator [Aureisphaera galaxeae]|uniref:MarR family winged helix-turn-helix transcriptional regulator n=1 Tax=Aureisphaera galaxeae TaxID=1538023 RepID=UPI002350C04F|nr:MarR family winged helix-turn-helix transcriptional regulator [Aureisphaera galaxeae]MDC8006117.1 MarR family winged helix-turn-helix transcriptional regulator [Aureisphaera galaxeae]
MKDNSFNPEQQQVDISSKIIAGFDRISEVFKVLLWEKAKAMGLSPIQIRILIFVAFHKEALCNVSHLSKEFNVTKPTISDAVKVLDRKGLIIKDFSSPDSRSYTILLSAAGEKIVSESQDFAGPLKAQIDTLDPADQEAIFQTLSKLIFQLNQKGILAVQRTCFKCRFYEKNGNGDYCNLLEKPLASKDIRLDCPEYQDK